jgi:hypothetical protein
MLIYNYHPITRHFTGISEAEYSPKEFNVFLIPAHATDIEPPICTDEQIAVFDEESKKWNLVDKIFEEHKKDVLENEKDRVYIPSQGLQIELTPEEKEEFEARKAAWEKLQSEKLEILLKLGLSKEDAEKLLVV